jgi:EAL domain-containing protein (putative c-di-GMP-specific phosphodiesterase class I)
MGHSSTPTPGRPAAEPPASGPHTSWPVRPTLLHILHGADTARPLLLRRHRLATPPAARSRPAAWMLYLEPIHAPGCATLLGAAAVVRGAVPDACGPDGPDIGQGAAWLLHAACGRAASWRSHPALIVSVGLPRDSPCDALLVEQVAQALDCSGLPPARLEIGLDGAALERAGADTLLALSALRDLGVGLALDEVGGAPAPDRLRRLPLTCLRLQASVTACLDLSRDARRVVAASVAASRALDAVVVATGVRTGLQRDILAELGCQGAQGSLFGDPMPAARFGAALAPSATQAVAA